MAHQYSMKKAALINAAGKYSKVILGLVVNAILARILSAEDYGIVAVVTVFSTFFTTLSDMGFGTAIIQNKELTNDDISNIYSFTIYISIILMIAFSGVSFLIASFYGDSVYVGLGQLLSISLLFNSLNMVPNGILNRNKKFVSIAIRTVVVYAGSAVITIILALFGLRYYALAIQAILTAFFTFVWNYYTTHPKFKFRFAKESILKVIGYSGYQFAFNLVNYFSRNLDNLLVGKYLGNAELGYYNKAYTLMLYPINNLTGVISPVLHPILSDYQNQIEVIYQKFLKVVRLLACIGIYVEVVCILAAPEIIRIMYGNNWDESIICFEFLSIAIATQMLTGCSGTIFQATGKTKLLFIVSCVNTAFTIGAILIGIFIGRSISALSLCVVVAYLFHFIFTFFVMVKYAFKKKFISFLKVIYSNIIILLIMFIGVILYPFNINGVLLSFIVKIIYLGIIYLICLFTTKEYKLFELLIRK